MEHKGQYFIPQDLRSKPMIFRNLGLGEFLIILFVGLLAYLMAAQLHWVLSSLTAPFVIYSILVAIIFLMPSPWNKGKKMYQSFYYTITKDRNVYARVYTEKQDISSTMIVPFVSEQINRAREERRAFSPLEGHQADIQRLSPMEEQDLLEEEDRLNPQAQSQEKSQSEDKLKNRL